MCYKRRWREMRIGRLERINQREIYDERERGRERERECVCVCVIREDGER